MYGPPPCRKRKVRRQVVCANVFDLWWSVLLLARMECATLSSYLTVQSSQTAWRIRLGERRVRPLCHLIVRQQTWQETLLDRRRWAVDVGISMRSPSLTSGGRHLQAR